jgi:hypothetical protein
MHEDGRLEMQTASLNTQNSFKPNVNTLNRSAPCCCSSAETTYRDQVELCVQRLLLDDELSKEGFASSA